MKAKIIFVLSMFSILSCNNQQIADPKLNLSTSKITVSGLSSGGYMAHQYHIAYSEQVEGAALLASGPYGCAEGDLNTALSNCMNNQNSPNVEGFLSLLKDQEKSGDIAPLGNLKNDKVWIYHGIKDPTVSQKVTSAQESLYINLDVIPKTVYSIDSGHGFPTLDYGSDCGSTESPYINNCKYDAVGEFFDYMYTNLNPKAAIKGKILKINQAKYLGKGEENTLADTGYLFAPEKCLKGDLCRVHVAFHGCNQNVENIGMSFIENLSYNTWAESNSIVILYPQTKSSYLPLNPKACWDWWGYTGEDYLLRKGKQLKQINNMISQL